MLQIIAQSIFSVNKLIGTIHTLRQPNLCWPSHFPSTWATVNIFQISHPPSLTTVNNFVFFQPFTFNKRNLTIFDSQPSLSFFCQQPSTFFLFVDPPSHPTVNNRQPILKSKPSHHHPLNVVVIFERSYINL